jgi:hypothetical protein
MTLRYDFQDYSPGSRTLLDFDEADGDHPAFDAPQGGRRLIEEIDRTIAEAARAAPGRIDRGTLTRAEADRTAAVLRAIAADLTVERTHVAACRAHFAAGGDWLALPDNPLPVSAAAPGEGGASWEEKIHVLRRELHFRRTYDPERVKRGRMTAAAAREQLERLEAVHHKYWWHMFTWTSPTGAAVGTPAWRADVREHTAKLELAAAAPAQAAAHEAEEQEALPV